MSDLSYLDTISNKELHAKCLQHGLPNIPVTDSSRKVIVRRLRATILGVPLNKSQNAASAAATKKTPRRETIHSSKVIPATENNNRVTGKSPSRNNNNHNTRRTIAAAAAHGNDYPVENSSVRSIQTTTTVSDVGSQSEDDDFYMNKSPSYKYSNENDRHRRSVSLTKSGVLTTSYTREVNQPHYEEAEDGQPQSHTYQRPHVAPATHTLPSYEPHVERTYSSSLPRQHLTQSLLNSTSYLEDTPDYNEQPIAQRSTYNGSAAPFNTAVSSTASIRQRQTIGGSGFTRGRLIQPTYRVNTLYPQLNEFYDQRTNADEPMELDTDSEPEAEMQQQQRSYGSTVESPYLSTFSRQLNAGKRSSPLARPQKRQTIANANTDSPKEQFRIMLRTLDQKYHLKFYFFLTLAVMLTTLVYVLLTP
ncbi:hypothetical protein ACLKA6_007415 [Drosophila palustris]